MHTGKPPPGVLQRQGGVEGRRHPRYERGRGGAAGRGAHARARGLRPRPGGRVPRARLPGRADGARGAVAARVHPAGRGRAQAQHDRDHDVRDALHPGRPSRGRVPRVDRPQPRPAAAHRPRRRGEGARPGAAGAGRGRVRLRRGAQARAGVSREAPGVPRVHRRRRAAGQDDGRPRRARAPVRARVVGAGEVSARDGAGQGVGDPAALLLRRRAGRRRRRLRAHTTPFVPREPHT